jgi:hypothetical protein
VTGPDPLFAPLPAMPLRFRGRHVTDTVAAFVRQRLDELGWVTPPTNLDATPVTFVQAPPQVPAEVVPNTIAVTLGDEPADFEEQLGGELVSVEYPVFVDLYAESRALAYRIGSDVKDILTRRTIPLLDWTTDPPVTVPGSSIEFDNVSGPRTPEGAAALQGMDRHWRVVQATAYTYFAVP